MIYAIAALLVFQLVGEVLVQWLHLPLPGPLVGMLLLFAALVWRGHVPQPLQETTGGLLRHMMLLLTPTVAGVVVYGKYVADEWLPFLCACTLGAAVTLVVTALTLRGMLKLQAPEEHKP